MAKSAKKPAPARSQGPITAAKPVAAGPKAAKPTSAASVPSGAAAKASDSTSKPNKSNSGSKQSRVLSMLRSPAGTTIAAMMLTTGWQQHSVRGFLAGVVRKRLKLKLTSKKVDGTRIYQIASGGDAKAYPRQAKRRAA
ncbi:MAG: DUF3489 domain-containing protein [Xanthobacteraceae bacterium]